LNAIANFIEEAGKLDRCSLSIFEPAIKEIGSIETTIQALLDVALDFQNQLSRLIILQVELTLPPEEEKPETITKSESGNLEEITDYTISIGSVNIYSIAGALGDTFANFESQTAGIAGIYSPFAFLEMPMVKTGLIEKIGQYSDKGVHIYRDAEYDIGIEAPEKKYDKTVSSGTETLYTSLKKSALIMNELETIHNNITNILVERESLSGESESQGYIEFAHYVKDFSVSMETISASLHTKILEAHIATDILALKNIPTNVPVLSGLTNSEQNPDIYSQNSTERSDIIQDFSEKMETITTALHARILEAQEVTDISALNKLSVKASSPAGSSKGEHSVIYPDQRIIEIPDFKPHEKLSMPYEASAISAARLSNAISMEYGGKDTIPLSRESQSAPSLYSLSTSISNAFETISDYITIAYEVDNRMSKLTEHEKEASKNIAPLLMDGSDAGASLLFERMASVGNVSSAEGQLKNIAFSIAAAGELQKAGSSAIKDMTSASPAGGGYHGPPVASLPNSIGNVMQILSGTQRETGAVSQNISNPVHFQNTFNIAINVKGGGEESELRDLGRKIGLILSDEIKRYGGIR